MAFDRAAHAFQLKIKIGIIVKLVKKHSLLLSTISQLLCFRGRLSSGILPSFLRNPNLLSIFAIGLVRQGQMAGQFYVLARVSWIRDRRLLSSSIPCRKKTNVTGILFLSWETLGIV